MSSGTASKRLASFSFGLWLLAMGIGCSPAAAGKNAGPERPPEDQIWVPQDQFDAGVARIVEAKESDLPQNVVASGKLAFDDLKVTHVFSPVSGRVTQVLARLGEEVNAGTPLAAIVSPDVGSAVSDEVKARADLTASERDRERQEKLLQAGAATTRDYETAEDTYQKAKAEEDRAQQRLRLLKNGKINAVTQEYQLPSPIQGRIIARFANPGVEIQGQYSGGTAVELFTVGSIDTLWLYADIPESDLPLVQGNAEVAARVLSYPDKLFHGRVEWISPTLDPQLRTFRIRCSVPNESGLLKPEMVAQVMVQRPPERRLAIPREAVVRINDHSFVYVAAGARPDGRHVFQRQQVQVPERSGPVSPKSPGTASEVFLLSMPSQDSLVPVLEGLATGQRVLVDTVGAHDADNEEVALSQEQARAGEVSVEPVDQREVPDMVTIGGRITFDDLRVSHVFPPVGGRISKVIAAPGQKVKKGDPLAVIVSPDVGSAFSDVLKAKADLDAADHELKRQKDLYAVHAGALRDLEAAEDNRDRSKAEYDRALERTKMLREGALSQVTQEFVLRSPIDGEVTARMANPGLEVQGQYSGAGNVVELFTIGQTDPLWLLGDLYEMDLPYVRLNDEVTFQTSAFSSKPVIGRVDWISDVLDPVMHTAKVRVVLSNADHQLRPEMYGMASISVPTRKAISIPRESLLRLGDETVVFVATGQTAEGKQTFRERRVLADDQLPGGRVPILSGLKPGDSVAAKGAIFLIGLL